MESKERAIRQLGRGCMALRESILVGVAVVAMSPLMVLAGAGSVSLNQMSTESSNGTTQSSRFITVSYGVSSYLVAPWLATWAGRLNLVQVNSTSGGTATDGQTWVGNLSTDILPRSRFPLNMSLDVSDSRVQTQTEAIPDGITGTTRSRVFRLREHYTSYDGTMINFWYNNALWEGAGSRPNTSSTTTDSYGVTAAKRFDYQTLNFSGTEFRTDQGALGNATTSRNLSLSHTYSPSTQSGVTTLLTEASTASSGLSMAGFTTTMLTGSSNFYWRPEYRPISVTGGFRLNENRTSQGSSDAQSFGGNVSASYAVSRSFRVNGGISGSIQDSAAGRSGNATQNVGVNYIGDPVYLGRVVYGWGTGANASNQMARGLTGSRDTQVMSTNFSHNLQRAWQLDNGASLTASAGQGLNYNYSSQGTAGFGISHSTRLGWNASDENSTTAAWVSLTDSRTVSGGSQSTGVTGSAGTTTVSTATGGATGTQSLMANLRRTQNVSRLSSLTADIMLNANRSLTSDSMISRSLAGNAEYQHSRVFGIYRLRFRSVLGLSQASALQGAQNVSSRWDNRFDYNIGMLVASVNYNISQTATNQTRIMMFQVTRNF